MTRDHRYATTERAFARSRRRRNTRLLGLTLAFLSWMPTGARAQVGAEACRDLAELVAQVPSLVLSDTDTVVYDDRRGRTSPGCMLRMQGRPSAMSDATNPDELLRQALAERGWQEDLSYAADGPDGTAFAFAHGTVRCMIRAAWDGGDDADPTYMPEDRYELVIGCVTLTP